IDPGGVAFQTEALPPLDGRVHRRGQADGVGDPDTGTPTFLPESAYRGAERRPLGLSLSIHALPSNAGTSFFSILHQGYYTFPRNRINTSSWFKRCTTITIAD